MDLQHFIRYYWSTWGVLDKSDILNTELMLVMSSRLFDARFWVCLWLYMHTGCWTEAFCGLWAVGEPLPVLTSCEKQKITHIFRHLSGEWSSLGVPETTMTWSYRSSRERIWSTFSTAVSCKPVCLLVGKRLLRLVLMVTFFKSQSSATKLEQISKKF